MIDFDLLFEELIAVRKPLSFEALLRGPEFRALATSLETRSLWVLEGFAGIVELTQAVRASGSLPRLGGRLPVFRGERMADGGLIEPIPFETAVAEGATHVLVLRSRPAGYRKPPFCGLGESLALHGDPGLVELLKARDRVYNRQAIKLEHEAENPSSAHLLQVAVPDHPRVIGRLETNGERISGSLRLGATAMASVMFTESIDLCWQPVVYRAASSGRSGEPAKAPGDTAPARGDLGGHGQPVASVTSSDRAARARQIAQPSGSAAQGDVCRAP